MPKQHGEDVLKCSSSSNQLQCFDYPGQRSTLLCQLGGLFRMNLGVFVGWESLQTREKRFGGSRARVWPFCVELFDSLAHGIQDWLQLCISLAHVRCFIICLCQEGVALNCYRNVIHLQGNGRETSVVWLKFANIVLGSHDFALGKNKKKKKTTCQCCQSNNSYYCPFSQRCFLLGYFNLSPHQLWNSRMTAAHPPPPSC